MPDYTPIEIGYFTIGSSVPTGLEARLAEFLIANDTNAHVDSNEHAIYCAHFGFEFTLNFTYGKNTAKLTLSPKQDSVQKPINGTIQTNCSYFKCLLRMRSELAEIDFNKPNKKAKSDYEGTVRANAEYAA